MIFWSRLEIHLTTDKFDWMIVIWSIQKIYKSERLVFQKGLKATPCSFQSVELSLWKIGQQFVPITTWHNNEHSSIFFSSCSALERSEHILIINPSDFTKENNWTMEDKLEQVYKKPRGLYQWNKSTDILLKTDRTQCSELLIYRTIWISDLM